jgi:dTDP-4-dehydrorhamnose 3,5-epimerase
VRHADAGLPTNFVQDNLSTSAPGVLRGLHLQCPGAQAKLVSILAGSIYDVAVDVRVGSPHFGRWMGAMLSADDHRQVFLPAGFAHGFVVTSAAPAMVTCKVDAPYAAGNELTIVWNDPALGIEWPLRDPMLSDKDRAGLRIAEVPRDRLPHLDDS